jgi:hypothetical protein
MIIASMLTAMTIPISAIAILFMRDIRNTPW